MSSKTRSGLKREETYSASANDPADSTLYPFCWSLRSRSISKSMSSSTTNTRTALFFISQFFQVCNLISSSQEHSQVQENKVLSEGGGLYGKGKNEVKQL
jgi:hypothetical protein